ncbi:MAG: DsbC family protein, partial [Neisseria sp.]|nr:DsbC family protein [Neisseria sp.]
MKRKALGLFIATVLPLSACGQTPVSNSKTQTASTTQSAADKAIIEKLEKAYAEQDLKVQSVQATPIAGLYEVVVSGNQVVYTDAKADFMLVGDLINVNTKESLTEERNEELRKIDYASLPLDKAIKEVRGNGKLHVAVFSDPDCPFCRRLEQEFAKMTDITIHTFMMPIPSLHPDAARKAEQIWCQPNPTQAWINWMR